MKKTVIYISSIITLAISGSFYFSARASSGDRSTAAEPSSTPIRYAADALRDQGFAILCGDPTSTSSNTNINKQISDLSQAIGASLVAQTIATQNFPCLHITLR